MSLGRDGPGLLVRDLDRGKDRQITAVVQIIARLAPDILLLNSFDYDYGQVALDLFANRLKKHGVDYPYRFALVPNSGLQSGVDLNGDGRTGGAADAQGYGKFAGSKGMALLSRFPILANAARDFSTLLWRDLAGASLPQKDGAPFPSAAAQAVQRLSSKGHWDVPVRLPDGRVLHVLASNPTPPVFDGPEDRNGKRNRDEIRFWRLYLDQIKASVSFAIMGDLNADPRDGEGANKTIQSLLNYPRLSDPRPASNGAAVAARQQGGANKGHKTPAKLDTVDWRDADGPGNMRVDYVLPSRDLRIAKSGVFWPAKGEAGYDLARSADAGGTRHRLVWVDVK